ncbi:MAG: heat-inducible transcriptional repressor HrcA [Candidatus Celaenobacter antarcticus]|nr:heat-inducible transcriptional repressor HrcA [Candidatus Celaenobacter antarcticus]
MQNNIDKLKISLTERQKKLLRAIILEYLKNAQAVGSKVLSDCYEFDLSSATIRNEMAVLAEKGYIEQLHTSAGRTPTEKGYKFYINDIIDFDKSIPDKKIKLMQQLLSENYQSLDRMLRAVHRFLAQISGQLSIIAEPDYSLGILQSLQIFKIEGNKLLIVVNLEGGIEKTFTLHNTYSLSDAQINALNRYINTKISGKPIHKIEKVNFDDLALDAQKESFLFDILSEIKKIIQQVKQYNIRFEGEVGFINQPEFNSQEKIVQLLKIIDNKKDFLNIFQQYATEDYTILMGDEIRGNEFKDLVLIFGRYRVMDLPGFIGILGTKRMDYRENIPIICFATRMITEMTTKGTVMPCRAV